MKILLFRGFASLCISASLMTVSLSTTPVDAQQSVCCPINSSRVDTRVIDATRTGTPPSIVDQQNPIVVGENQEQQADVWIDRVSNSLKKSAPDCRTCLPITAKPGSATPIDNDFFAGLATELGTAPVSEPNAESQRVDKETEATETGAAGTAAHAAAIRQVLIMRAREDESVEDENHALDFAEIRSQLDSAGVNAEQLAHTLIVNGLRMSIPSRQSSIAGLQVKPWEARQTAALTGDTIHIVTSSISQTFKSISWTGGLRKSQVSGVEASGVEVGCVEKVDPAQESVDPEFSQYDRYDAAAGYRYGCFGYESIYGIGQAATVVDKQAASIVHPADFDGYMAYDYDGPTARIARQSASAGAEVIAASNTNRIQLVELRFLPAVLQSNFRAVVGMIAQFDFGTRLRRILLHSQLAFDKLLCDSEMRDRLNKAIWLHRASVIEIHRAKVRQAEQKRLAMQRIQAIRIARTLNAIAGGMQAISGNLLEFANEAQDSDTATANRMDRIHHTEIKR